MIYVLSDIHGHEGRFASILKQIDLQSEDTLYVLGDVIDRNPGGIRILQKIMAMENARMLLGNHEYMMLRALGQPYDDNADDGRAMEHWYLNGGRVTHAHLRWLRKGKQQEILDYLQALPLSFDVKIGDKSYKLVHAAPAECYTAEPPYQNPAHFAVWKRLGIEDVIPGDGILIFGHTPTKFYQDCMPMEIWQGDRRIGIDCGSAYGEGRLACLRLDDGKVFYSEEG